MNTNGIIERHWLFVGLHFLVDAGIFFMAFLFGMQMRFGQIAEPALHAYWPGMLVGAMALSSACYIWGLYSPRNCHHTLLERTTMLAMCYGIALLLMLALFYLSFSTRIGRGVMLISIPASFAFILLHHYWLLQKWRNFRERVALIVASEADEEEIKIFHDLGSPRMSLVGVIGYDGRESVDGLSVLGDTQSLLQIAESERLDRVVCTGRCLKDYALHSQFCKLRYSGVSVMPLVCLWEEVHQKVPMQLVTPEWLMHASGSPQMFYIKKLKRGFDICMSLLGLVFLSPALVFGILLVKLTSPGPVFYRQSRLGRLDRLFTVIKLRTMVVDAEKDGPQWTSEDDPRVTRVGRFLRKFRIDEIPQLISVLRGDMSFVGPRPERPEFVEMLSKEIPFYIDRLMVQPGITGWAQVNYSYGASVEDARRKLEYDLYYIKHMSLFLDLFILLDTVRIIVCGGIVHPDAAAETRTPPTLERVPPVTE